MSEWIRIESRRYERINMRTKRSNDQKDLERACLKRDDFIGWKYKFERTNQRNRVKVDLNKWRLKGTKEEKWIIRWKT